MNGTTPTTNQTGRRIAAAIATVVAAAAFAVAPAAAPAAQERVALPNSCEEWGCGTNHNDVLATS